MRRNNFFQVIIILSFLINLCQDIGSIVIQNNEYSSPHSKNINLNFSQQTLSSIHFDNYNPIKIEGDTDFHNQALSGGWQGNGTKRDPYLIVGYNITSSGSDNLISIENTNVHFKISNCYLIDGFYGIRLYNVRNGYIDHNTVQNNSGSGILLSHSNNCSIESNYVFYNGNGIYLDFSGNNTVSNNNISTNRLSGVYSFSSVNNIYVTNTINNNIGSGIFLDSSVGSNIISNNKIAKNSNGLHLSF
ncbi:MAG: right-handed parallel beta-helix repeat-containing protein, partial [Candidatus Hodarchaeota archaeon]